MIAKYDYSRVRDLAVNMIAKFGGRALLTAFGDVYDPLTGTVSPAPVDPPRMVDAVITTRKSWANNGVMTTQSIAVMTDEPKVGDRLAIGPLDFTILEVEVAAPDGETLKYVAVLSR